IHEYLDHIIDSGNRLSGTIENILEFSEALSGERKAHMDEIIITDVLENISGQYAPMAKEKNISIRIDDLAQNQIINADHAMLARALGCLLDNAIKFSSDNTEITIGAKSGDNTTSIFVSDQGCGMSADDIVIAKKPLMQVDGGLTRQAEGTGIGLSLAILLAELQGGNLEIESTPDVGTSVSISLPANGTSEDAVE
ncbi:MAG: HAMP domain-containing histidine kinase, partial [Rhodospirillaceae bacterium]|nr:HAMP domain-containing histidine kinase [Rhodospirillaceae bacterium]